MAKGLILLLCVHLLIFRRFYFTNPFLYSRSEALEQAFACSRLLGEHLRRYGLFTLRPIQDDYYYPDHSALPFLSTYYLPHRLQAWLGSWLNLDQAWVLYSLAMVLHYAASSIAVYILLGSQSSTAIFAALTLSYLGYSMKQNSSIVYTLAWVPVFILSALHNSMALMGISVGMMISAGYWPVTLYTIPLGCLFYFL